MWMTNMIKNILPFLANSKTHALCGHLKNMADCSDGLTNYSLPDNITGCTALAVGPDVLTCLSAKYHVKTNATYSCHNRTLYQ